jgi:hypothetical protein
MCQAEFVPTPLSFCPADLFEYESGIALSPAAYFISSF